MNFIKEISVKLSIIITFTVLIGCGDEVKKISTSSSSTGSSSVGIIEPSKFYVSVFGGNNTGTVVNKFFIHRYDATAPTNVSLPCEFTSTSTNKNITCYVEAPELDLFYQGVGFQFNAPPGMCEYVYNANFWYFAAEPMYGPTKVTINTLDGVVTGCTAEGPDGLGVRNCQSESAAYAAGDVAYRRGEEVLCLADYSKRSNISNKAPKINCCQGKYTKVSVSTDSGVTTTTESAEDWAGDIYNCVDGPASATNVDDPDTKRPTRVYFYASDGINSAYDLRGGKNGTLLLQNLYYANYYSDTPVANPSIEGLYPTFRGGATLSSDPKLGLAPQQSYAFYCLDRHGDTIGTIDVYVRSWKNLIEFNNYKSTGIGNSQIPGNYFNYRTWIDVAAEASPYDQYPYYIYLNETAPGYPIKPK